jgi:hypothetical protein
LEGNSLLSLPVLILTLTAVKLYTDTGALSVAVVLLTGGGGGGAGLGAGADGDSLTVFLTLPLSKSGFICACVVLMANNASVERNTIFRILVCFKGVKMDTIYEGALPEKQEILKIMEKQEDLRFLKEFICTTNSKA